MPLSVDCDGARTRSRRGRARKSVNYSELAIDSEGNEKRTQSKRKKNKPSKVVRKRLRRSRGDSDDVHGDSDDAPSIENSNDSDVAAKDGNSRGNAKHGDSSDDDTFATAKDHLDTDLSDSESDEPKKGKGEKNKKSDGKINWDEIELDVPEAEMTAEKKRQIEYRKAAENVHRYLEAVDNLNLPPNPLDKLLNGLGGKSSRPVRYSCLI